MSTKLTGSAASEGMAMGPATVLLQPVLVTDRCVSADQIANEVTRLRCAVKVADAQMASLAAKLQAEDFREGHLVLEAHRMMLRDEELIDGARRSIERDHSAAECAVARVIDDVCARFAKMSDPYLRDRGHDVRAVGERLLRALLGLPEASLEAAVAGTIGIGALLSPIDALQLPLSGIVGFATEHGGRTSHAAIILRALDIPLVVGVPDLVRSVRPGESLIVDGERGEVIVDPSPVAVARYTTRLNLKRLREQTLRSRTGAVAVTRDGVRVELAANIESPAEVEGALALGADSIGLFRTELLYLDRLHLPDEDEQFEDAKAVVVAMNGRPVTFRTLDIGGEKWPLSVDLPRGMNPSLGLRAIRFSRRRPDIFRTQVRALYRASAFGPLRILFPLVSGVSELRECVGICQSIADDLQRGGIPIACDVQLGAMIETPSAALTVDHLAEWASFFSIGTNDLIQYAFAVDRENEDLAYLYHPLHPAVLRLLRAAIDAARAANRPISICGDMAGDPALTWVLIALGARSLSMATRFIPAVKSIVVSSSVNEMEEMLGRVLLLSAEDDVERLVISVMRERFPLELPSMDPGTESAVDPL